MTEASKTPKLSQPAASGDEAAIAASETTAAKPPAAKKEKAPALEDKPFADFIRQDFVPAIQSGLSNQGLADLNLEFTNAPVSISGVPNVPDCWQIIGKWKNETRQFNLYFFAEDIQGQRGFSCISNGGIASSIESFLIDERKMTLDLLLFGLTKRLNAQKWLLPN